MVTLSVIALETQVFGLGPVLRSGGPHPTSDEGIYYGNTFSNRETPKNEIHDHMIFSRT